MEKKEKSLARLAPVQGHYSNAIVRENYTTFDCEYELFNQLRVVLSSPSKLDGTCRCITSR